MRIGKQDGAFTAIATSDADTITIRGHDLCGDLIGKIDFTDYFWLLVTGQTPDLLNEGSAVKIIDSKIKESIIIANTGKNVFTALSIACTHNGFEVEYKHDRKVFRCISVNHAEFSCDGHVLDGPTERKLTSYPIRLQNDKVIVSNVV